MLSKRVKASFLYSISGSPLAVGAQADAAAQQDQLVQMIPPLLIQDLQQDELLQLVADLRPQPFQLFLVTGLGGLLQGMEDGIPAGVQVLVVLQGHRQQEGALVLEGQFLHIPEIGGLVVTGAFLEHPLQGAGEEILEILAQILAPHGAAAQAVDHLALLVDHVVVLQQVLADLVVLGLDADLGLLDVPWSPCRE